MDNKFKKLGNFIKKHKDIVMLYHEIGFLEQQRTMFDEILDKDPKLLRERIESVLKSNKTKEP